MKKAYYLFLVMIVLAPLVLAGCTGDDTTTSTTTTTPSQTGTTTTNTVPTASGVLHLYGVDPYTLDPALAAEITSHSYICQLFNGLVRLDDDLEVVTDIAASWDVSDDLRTYIFHLRDDVYFHDGGKVTAEDVKYSWERACNPATGSYVAQTYLGDIVGVIAMLSGQASSISGVSVEDDYTLSVTIDEPKSYFLSKLTYPTAYVVDRNNVNQGSNWWLNPNGTGPFKLKEWEQSTSLVLERNTNYHGQVPSLERVEYALWSGVPMNMYENGEIDVAGVSVLYIDRVTDPAGSFAGQLKQSSELSFSWIGFNTTEEPFDDIHVRRAFSLALDKDKIISVMYRNMLERAEGILPPGMPGFNEDLEGISYDPELARQELAASRYGSAAALPDITLTTSGYGGGVSQYLEAAATLWQENLSVEVTIRVLDPEFYIYNLKSEKDEMFDMGWIADYPHPQNFLEILFHTGAENNFAEYSNPEIDAVLDQAAVAATEKESQELYRQAEQMLADDVACLPLWFGENYYLVKPYVNGYELNAMGLAPLNKVSITD